MSLNIRAVLSKFARQLDGNVEDACNRLRGKAERKELKEMLGHFKSYQVKIEAKLNAEYTFFKKCSL